MEALSVLPEAQMLRPLGDTRVTGVAFDSRLVGPGDLFVAIRGEKTDGLQFVSEAVARGAVAVVTDRPMPQAWGEAAWIRVESPRRALALLAAKIADTPAEKLVLAGVTGTNGKTTTTLLLQSLLATRYGRAGFMGTVGYSTGRRESPAPRTTPEAPVIQAHLAEMVADGVRAAAMEVSSHALALDRVVGCRFDLALFTNLTHDHLDFHGSMEEYFQAKRMLFAMRKPRAPAIVNADDPYGARLAREIESPVLTFSALGRSSDVRAHEIRCDLAETSFEVRHAGAGFRVVSSLAGRFNVENLLAAAASGLALGFPPQEISAALAAVRHVPGRLERVEAGQAFPIFVDYAHTPDALERLLQAIRDLTDKKIVLVFGCGGDRDRAKRFPMGQIAGRLANLPILTSDNPRSEDPESILDEVERGVVASGAERFLRVVDRREAIAAALAVADRQTVVVIAGKGHETTQVIGNEELPFDDRQVAAELAARA